MSDKLFLNEKSPAELDLGYCGRGWLKSIDALGEIVPQIKDIFNCEIELNDGVLIVYLDQLPHPIYGVEIKDSFIKQMRKLKAKSIKIVYPNGQTSECDARVIYPSCIMRLSPKSGAHWFLPVNDNGGER